MQDANWAIVIPMANEEPDFEPFITKLKPALDASGGGRVFLIVDRVSRDNTLALCRSLEEKDRRFTAVWAPENRNVVDAYIRGYKEALNVNCRFIIEMDAGLSHDPASIPVFLRYLEGGYECVFGSRFIGGGSMGDSPWKRRWLSKTGTLLSNVLLGTTLHDMTSGYQGFTREVVEKFVSYPLLSKAHFYQTEIRYLLRKRKSIEIPISYRAPSPRVSEKAVKNSLTTLLHYFILRITFRSPYL